MIDHAKGGKKPRNEHPPVIDDNVEHALVAANAATILRHRHLSIPLLIWRNGQMVEVSPFDVPLPLVEAGADRNDD